MVDGRQAILGDTWYNVLLEPEGKKTVKAMALETRGATFSLPARLSDLSEESQCSEQLRTAEKGSVACGSTVQCVRIYQTYVTWRLGYCRCLGEKSIVVDIVLWISFSCRVCVRRAVLVLPDH